MPLAIVFDTETTGLPPKNNWEPLTAFPFVIQFSYVIVDTDTCKIKKIYNQYIKIDDTIVIEPKITEITGITREIIDSHGIHIGNALQEFFHDYMEADVLVGHNLDFDMKMVLAESARWGLTLINETFDQHCRFGNNDPNKLFDISNPNFYCTMLNGTDLCKIQRINSWGSYLKQPKLSELYQHIFETQPEGLHNSLVDVLACLRCYMDMKHQYRIGDDVFAGMLATK
jgi:DNA polymerase III epsilon subunit-like protein